MCGFNALMMKVKNDSSQTAQLQDVQPTKVKHNIIAHFSALTETVVVLVVCDHFFYS